MLHYKITSLCEISSTVPNGFLLKDMLDLAYEPKGFKQALLDIENSAALLRNFRLQLSASHHKIKGFYHEKCTRLCACHF
jgi:hypothetical protein